MINGIALPKQGTMTGIMAGSLVMPPLRALMKVEMAEPVVCK